jgi:hypothetical protein
MLTRLLPRRLPVPDAVPVPPPPQRPQPDTGYDALHRLRKLRDQLVRRQMPRRSSWSVPPLFFFDHRRQAELEATLPQQHSQAEAELAHLIGAELPSLTARVELRRIARAIPDLKAAATALAPTCPAAQQLAELLSVPDDEIFVVLDPATRTGYRLVVQGVADVGQFSVLLAHQLPGPRIAERFVIAYRDANPVLPAGIPLVVEAHFQLSMPSALQADGTLPSGFAGCQHWLWPTMPLATVPRVKGERLLLLGEPAFRLTWDVNRRFPTMPANVELVETLSSRRVVEYFNRLTGKPIPTPEPEAIPLRRAA